MKLDYLIMVASWEERFLKGLLLNIRSNKPTYVILYYVKDYLKFTSEVLEEVQRILIDEKIELELIELTFTNPVDNYLKIKQVIGTIKKQSTITFDYTTTPRSVLWLNLLFLKETTNSLRTIYYKPGDYPSDWLSRDPDKPRLVYRMSGVGRLGRPTLLLMITGYDNQRPENLLTHFEPSKTIFLVQKSNEFVNEQYTEYYHEKYSIRENCSVLPFNAFETDYGYQQLVNSIEPFLDDYNVIATSMGPKPSALSLLRLVNKFPEIALCYVPCKEFNRNYSKEIGKSYESVIDTTSLEMINL